MEKKQKRPFGMILLIILFTLSFLSSVTTLFLMNNITDILIWSSYGIFWLFYLLTITFAILEGYLIYLYIKRKKKGFRLSLFYFSLSILFLIFSFILITLNSEVTQEAMNYYISQRADTLEETSFVSSFATNPGFMFLITTISIAFYAFISWYVIKKKGYFSEV